MIQIAAGIHHLKQRKEKGQKKRTGTNKGKSRSVNKPCGMGWDGMGWE
jgi:hypothetical protein